MIAVNERFRSALALSMLAVASAPSAAEYEFGVRVGAGTSDNISRTETDPVDENLATAGVAFSILQDSRLLNADISSDLSYVEYLDDTYDSDLVGGLNGEVNLRFVPDRFEWQFTDNFGQVLIDSTAVGTPQNRENLNYFTTGPDFTLALGDAAKMTVGGRYSLVDYEKTLLDSQRLQGSLALTRLLTSTSSLSLNASLERAEFDDALLSEDYDRQEFYLRYAADGARVTASIDIGQTILKDSREESNDGFLLRASVLRRLSRSMSLSVEVSQEFADSSEVFRRSQSSGGVTPGAQAIRSSSVPFENRAYSLGWEIDGTRTDLGIGISRSEERFDAASTANRDLTTIDARLSRQLNRVLSSRVSGTYLDATYAAPGIDYDEVRGELSLDWQVGRLTSLALLYQRFDRTGKGFQEPYEESVVWLLLGVGTIAPGSTGLLTR